MADKKISQLNNATTPLAGTEVLPIVQSSTTVKVASNDLTVRNVRANATTGILQVTGPAAGSTRIMTVPDANFTVARTDAANSFTADQTLATGNLVVGTAGKGIDFSANTAAAGMTSELLDWYEEGTWTPVCSRETGGNITAVYDTQLGKYTRIGNLVMVSGLVVITSVSAQGSGINEIKGLPFNPADNSLGAGSVARNTAFDTDVVRATWGWGDGRILFSSNVNSLSPTAVDWQGGYLNFSFTYFV